MTTCDSCNAPVKQSTLWFSWLRGYHDGPAYHVCRTGGSHRFCGFVGPTPDAPYAGVTVGKDYPWGPQHPPKGAPDADQS